MGLVKNRRVVGYKYEKKQKRNLMKINCHIFNGPTKVCSDKSRALYYVDCNRKLEILIV